MDDPGGQVVLYNQISNMYIAAFKPNKQYVYIMLYKCCNELSVYEPACGGTSSSFQHIYLLSQFFFFFFTPYCPLSL